MLRRNILSCVSGVKKVEKSAVSHRCPIPNNVIHVDHVCRAKPSIFDKGFMVFWAGKKEKKTDW